MPAFFKLLGGMRFSLEFEFMRVPQYNLYNLCVLSVYNNKRSLDRSLGLLSVRLAISVCERLERTRAVL